MKKKSMQMKNKRKWGQPHISDKTDFKVKTIMRQITLFNDKRDKLLRIYINNNSSDKGSTTIENIIYEKYIYEEVSRVAEMRNGE